MTYSNLSRSLETFDTDFGSGSAQVCLASFYEHAISRDLTSGPAWASQFLPGVQLMQIKIRTSWSARYRR